MSGDDTCKVTQRQLQAWFDGQAGEQGDDLATHVETCDGCQSVIESWGDARGELIHLIDAGIGDVEPLLALRNIRRRIAEAEEGSWFNRFRVAWRDAWTFNRRAVAGVALAASIGVISAPTLVAWLAERSAGRGGSASVVVEALEFDPTATAVVYRPDRTTTLIWVEPAGHEGTY